MSSSIAGFVSQRISRTCLLRPISKAANISSLAVQYSEFGKAQNVLKLVSIDNEASLMNLSADEVLLKHLVAPINPSDLNMIQGVYGIKPSSFPAIGGQEGVAVVEKVGSSVSDLKEGDWVIPHAPGLATWTQRSKAKAAHLLRVSNDIPAPYAATVAVNPCSAYRMLEDFERLRPGDWLVQNGANSMVGQAVIQLARARGIRTLNVIRSDRPDAATTVRLLTNLGGDLVVTDEYLQSRGFQEIARELPPVRLALNCVGGDSAALLARTLAPHGTLVTYGSMAHQPLAVPLDLLARKQLRLRGFWVSQWVQSHSKEERGRMVEELLQLVRAKQLSFFFQLHDLDDFPFALQQALEPFALRKVLLSLAFPDRLAEHDGRPDKDYWVFDTSAV
mmetsp:Transcript_26771/g.36869  ORF Transcript_26771/g.36869 Transcript_26771/m.36869 type:complete len:391 (+) Transcript_26771:810-1982(+)